MGAGFLSLSVLLWISYDFGYRQARRDLHARLITAEVEASKAEEEAYDRGLLFGSQCARLRLTDQLENYLPALTDLSQVRREILAETGVESMSALVSMCKENGF